VLIGNYSVHNKMAGRSLGNLGFSASRPNFTKTNSNRNRFFGQAAWDLKAAQPNGNLPPGAWVLPQRSGGMSSYSYILGSGTLTSGIAGGRNAVATLSGSGDLTGTAALIVSLVASLSGTGGISDADMRAFLNALATLSGTGTLTSTVSAKGSLNASLAGISDLLGTIRANGELSADIVIGASDPLSPQALAAAVWNALAAEFNDTGSFGELVQNNVGVDYDRILREVRDSLIPHIWAS
jgi:hypothetical protein